MKNSKLLIAIFSILFSLNTFAQNTNDNIIKTTTVKNFIIEKNGKKIPYKLKIHEQRRYNVTFEKEDKNKLNQDLVDAPNAYVTKLIFINNDLDKSYDRYLVLRYKKDPTDSFELTPTLRGFAVKVDKRYLEYILGEGIHFVNNEDKDYFIVDEFDVLD